MLHLLASTKSPELEPFTAIELGLEFSGFDFLILGELHSISTVGLVTTGWCARVGACEELSRFPVERGGIEYGDLR